MLHLIANHVIRLIREHGDLNYQDIGEEIGTEWQVPWRWEHDKRQNLLKRSQEEILVRMSKLTRLEFGRIMCEVLSEFIGRRFTMGPAEPYVPAWPLRRAAKLYGQCHDLLDQEDQEIIDELMCQGRTVGAQAEQSQRVLAKVMIRTMREGLAKKGRSLPSDVEDSPADALTEVE